MERNPTRKKGGSKCAMKDCSHVARRPPGDKLSYFSFPKDSDRAVTWVHACNRDDLLEKNPLKLHKNYRVCSDHFPDSMFLHDSRNRLSIDAVPSRIKPEEFEQIFIKEEPLEENTRDSELYENVLQSVKKEEDVSDDENQITKNEDTNSNDFCCTVCNKSFTRKTTLTRHMRIHKGIKQYECATCCKSFLEKSYLKTSENSFRSEGLEMYNM